jgi:thymidine kinase
MAENKNKKDPEFVIFTGPMFSEKTSKLLSLLDRCTYKHKDKKIVAFKPRIDERYSQSSIVTHGGRKWEATNVSNGKEILEHSHNFDIIAVDEAFMIDGCAEVLIKLFKQGKTIYVSSLQLSASGNPFEEVKDMMPWATKIEVCAAVCPVTQKDAYYTIRKIDGLNEISVGGSECYEPRSWEHTPFMRDE